MKFTYEIDENLVPMMHRKWLPVEGVRFTFKPDGVVEVELTSSLHNAKVIENYLQPNDGKAVVQLNSLAL